MLFSRRTRIMASALLLLIPAKAALAADPKACSSSPDERAIEKCLRALDAVGLDEIQKFGVKIKQQAEKKSFSAPFDVAHRAWLAFRDADCKAKTFESYGGSGYNSIFATCLIEMNNIRVEDLKGRADSP